MIALFAEREHDDELTIFYQLILDTRTSETIKLLKSLDTQTWKENKLFQLRGLIRELDKDK